MTIPIFFPNLKKGSTKDQIIEVLTREKSLTNQQIFYKLKKEYYHPRSYQTIRQALMELVENGVLEKNGKQYSLAIDWIKSMESYVALLKSKYIDKKDIKIIDKNTKEIKLDSLSELGHFVLYSFREHFFDADNEKDLYMFVHHLWFPFFDKNKRDLLRDFFSENNNYIYVKNSNFLDKILSIFYGRYGKVSFNSNIDHFFDIIIQGDCLAKIYMPEKLRRRMDKLYKFKNLSFDIIDELSDLTFSNYPIKISIIRDREMVREIKNKLKIKTG